MELMKFYNDGTTECYLVESVNSDRCKDLLKQGFKEAVPTPKPSLESIGEFDELISDFVETEKTYLERWIVRTDKAKVAAEIERLNNLLADSNGLVLEAYEYTIAGLEPPFDTTALQSERQAIRDRIAELTSL